MLISKVVQWIVKLIMSSLEGLLYEAKKEDAKEQIDENKRKSKIARNESDRAVAGFRLRLEQYRKSESGRNLQELAGGVRTSSGKAGAHDKDSGRGAGSTD